MSLSLTHEPHLAIQWLGSLILKITGWRVDGIKPDITRSVIIAAPHTSNWDFFYLLAAAASLKVKIHWLGKSSLFWGPLGPIMRGLGGIPVDRSKPNQLVAQLARRFKETASLHLVIPPSGTRGFTEHWRSGFYHVAREADVPVIFGFLDYSKKLAGISQPRPMTGNVRLDMDAVRQFYRGIVGRYPALASRIALRDEAETTPPRKQED
jgi:1-acyl-sn-glycerol-3-phosphate acyltransferase